MYNITKGNIVPMKATLVHDEERFPVGASTGLSVRIYGHYRYIDAVNVVVDQEEDGVLYFDVPATLNAGVYGVEVKGKVNSTPWRTATDCVFKITPSTERNDGSEAVPEGDTYDIVMRVQLYKQQSSDRAIEEHDSDDASHPYILGELERIEGEIPTLPEHIVTDANYVHTDNNYTDEEKTKLANAITEEQDPTVPQWAKQSTKPSYTPQEVGALPANTPLFDGNYNSLSNKPDLSGFITISVNNLVNYYLKSEVYTKTEVANLIAAIQQFHYEIYASISAVASPAGNVLYLIGPVGTGADKYEEYVYDSTKQEPWVKIGDTSIDLSDYYTKGQTDNAITAALNTALADYTTTAALTLLLAGKQDVINDLAAIRSGASAGATAYQKPQGGIPSTDMSQDVQTSLGKADSSLQPTQQTLTDAQKQQARKNIGAAGVDDVPTLPGNVSYFSGDNGDGVVPTGGIRGENIVASSAISVNPDVVTAITGEIGSATTITLVVPNDSLRHVWDMFFTTASDGGATIVVPQGATLHVPAGYSIASGKTYEVRIIGVGNHYYLTCQEYN